MKVFRRIIITVIALCLGIGSFATYSSLAFADDSSQSTDTSSSTNTTDNSSGNTDNSNKDNKSASDNSSGTADNNDNKNTSDTDNSSLDKDADTDTKKAKKPLQTVTDYPMMVKVAGSKNYAVWQNVVKGKPKNKVADGSNFQFNHLQSDEVIQTKKARYWRIYVDGRQVGYVNEKYFVRNTIAVAKTVTLVRNSTYQFNTREAISYVTNYMGTAIDKSQVQVSHESILCNYPHTYNVKYTYGSATATVKITIRNSTKEGIADLSSAPGQTGTNDYKTWREHYGSSVNYVSPTEYSPETEKHTLTSGDLTLKTRLYQPVVLSVENPNDDNINRVGHIPEGVTVSDGWAYTSLLSHTDLMDGHIVGYNLEKLTNPFNAQNLLTMSQTKFNNYVKNIKVSPYIPIGHGQAMGSTDKYIYVLSNDHATEQPTDSEELIQIRKSDMLINKIWTIKTWVGDQSAPRYFQNAVITSDHTMYGLYHNKDDKSYEYWELTRKGDNWYPKMVGKTNGEFVNNGAPVQGFTYDPDNDNFYIAFNDLIFKIDSSGAIKDTYQFNTGREIEGISVSDSQLYVNLAQRAELLVSTKIN
ncbi:SH3-like domain-containing protein [Lactobacillus sp. ESL0791]|uniref:SH3-like domain-containing protein n=1 Tax=Lactobacillus sp. ESL0791 TaxID=2983234 RepID=UPI0023F6B375|nr:SH3-like domain-containing protein [Lactobacillus sp. ESL0791]MDF7638601.1 SH3-like domain-containing protein [Lactobacillus sp. ESL0791]